MGYRVPDEQAQLVELREAYDDAFRQLLLQVHLLQSVVSESNADDEAIAEARHLVEQAQLGYRENRDRLVRFMLAREGHEHTLDLTSQIESLAHQLWEQSGRPSGRAEEHWYLAERMVHGAP